MPTKTLREKKQYQHSGRSAPEVNLMRLFINYPVVGTEAEIAEEEEVPTAAMAATFCLIIVRVSFHPSDGKGWALSKPVGLVTYLLLQAVWLAQPEKNQSGQTLLAAVMSLMHSGFPHDGLSKLYLP